SSRRAASPVLRRALTTVCILLALQGAVGLDQYETHLPTELVWVHVGLASLRWVAPLWAACAAGSLAPRAVAAQERRPAPPARVSGFDRRRGVRGEPPRDAAESA